MVSEARIVELSYRVVPRLDAWVLPEGPVPESHAHNLTVTHLYLLFLHWAAQHRQSALVTRNLALRFMESAPRVGIDPDVALIDPAPPDVDALTSLCTWKRDHVTPQLAIEVVSPSHPYKDYTDIQDRYAAAGVPELWVLDPLLLGPRALGGPHALQVWQAHGGDLRRVHAGSGPFQSSVLPAWVRVIGRDAIVSNDEAGLERWLTAEQDADARAAADRERAAADRARAEAAERRIAELEAELAKKR